MVLRRSPRQKVAEPQRGSVRSAGSRAWFGPLLILVVALGLLHPLWTRREIIYSKHSDIVAEHLSIKAVGRRAILDEGHFPLWNPSMNAGAPAFANPQSMYLFPFDLLYLAAPLDVATNLVILLNILLAGASMYLFGRQVFGHGGPALFAALAYMLSYRYLAMVHAGWLPKMSMYALTPLLFWACARLLERPSGRRVVTLALVVALALLQGDMQQLYYSGLACLVYIVACLPSVVPAARVRALLLLAGGGTLGAMLAGPALLPRLEFASLSTRAVADYRFFLADPPAGADLSTLLDPDDRGGERDEFWENNFYFGFWLLPLWALGFLRSGRRATLLLVAALALVVLCFDTPVLKWLYDYLPGFKLFRQSARLLLLAQFVVVLLAGMGVDELAGPVRRGRRPLFVAATVVALLIGLLAAAQWDRAAPLAVCGLVAAAGVSVLLSRTPQIVTVGLLCLLPVLDAALRSRPLITTAPLAEAFPAHAMHAPLRRDANPGRVLATSRRVIPYGMAGYFGIDLVNGYASLNLKHYVEYLAILQHGTPEAIPAHPVLWTDYSGVSKPHMLRALDVRYIVGNWSSPFERIGYERVADYRQVPVFVFYEGIKRLPVKVWRLAEPLGPAYFAQQVVALRGEDDSLRALATSTSALTAQVIGMDRGLAELDCAGGQVKPLQRQLNCYEYELESAGPNFLILSQIWYPGWRAELDGDEIELYRVNHALLGCSIPPGRHRLTLAMTSPPLRWGILFAVAAASALIGLLLADSRRRARPVTGARA
jgi:hypothetical protein